MLVEPAHLQLRRELDGPHPSPTPPPGTSEVRWHGRHARAVHELLVHSYREGGGRVRPYELWLPALVGDDEFDASSCFLLLEGEALVGVALCWSSAFIKDLCVAEASRRRAFGSYLLRRAFSHFAARGASSVELKVELANASARQLYARHGFAPITEV